MQAKVSNLPWLHHYSPYNPSLQSEAMSGEELINSAIEKCFQPYTERFANIIKQAKNFGLNNSILDQLQKFFSSNFGSARNDNSILEGILNSLIGLFINTPPGDSEELVMQQGNIISNLFRELIGVFGNNPEQQYLKNVAKLISKAKTGRLNAEDTLDNTLAYLVEHFSSMIDTTKWPPEFKDAMKNALMSYAPALRNTLLGEEPSAEDKRNLLNAMIGVLTALNIGSIRPLDQPLSADTDIKETPEFQQLLAVLGSLSDQFITDDTWKVFEGAGLSGCLDVIKELLANYSSMG